MWVTYREFYSVRVDGPKPGEHNVGRITKVVLHSIFDRCEKEQRVYEKRKQAQSTRTHWESENHNGQLRGK
jgi:hypothetical protein